MVDDAKAPAHATPASTSGQAPNDPALAVAHGQFRRRLDRRAVVGHLLGTNVLDLKDHENGLAGQKLRFFRADLNLYLCPGRPGEQQDYDGERFSHHFFGHQRAEVGWLFEPHQSSDSRERYIKR
jgi:hypothetical protein